MFAKFVTIRKLTLFWFHAGIDVYARLVEKSSTRSAPFAINKSNK